MGVVRLGGAMGASLKKVLRSLGQLGHVTADVTECSLQSIEESKQVQKLGSWVRPGSVVHQGGKDDWIRILQQALETAKEE